MKNQYKKYWQIVLIFTAGIVLAVVFSGFYFKNLIEKERLEMQKELGRAGQLISTKRPEISDMAHLEKLQRLQKERVERYFLSEVDWTGSSFGLRMHDCLYSGNRPIYPFYIYETWSYLAYPDAIPEIALVRYLLLPEDNTDFQPDKNCFIKEIKTEQDWREVEEKYNFSRNRF